MSPDICLAEPSFVVQTSNLAPPQATYDVASIKLHKSLDFNSGTHSDDRSYTASNVSLATLLAEAYGIRRDLISGIPKWADDIRFDIQAKSLDPDLGTREKLTEKQDRAMLATMLADRFHVKVHTETKMLRPNNGRQDCPGLLVWRRQRTLFFRNSNYD